MHSLILVASWKKLHYKKLGGVSALYDPLQCCLSNHKFLWLCCRPGLPHQEVCHQYYPCTINRTRLWSQDQQPYDIILPNQIDNVHSGHRSCAGRMQETTGTHARKELKNLSWGSTTGSMVEGNRDGKSDPGKMETVPADR